jgi:hypothetical protein
VALSVDQVRIDGQLSKGDDLFPVVYVCRDATVNLERACAWASENSEILLEAAQKHGASLYRGFGLNTAEDFDAFVTAFGLPAFTYEDSLSNAVRMSRTPRVFTANEAPPTVQIYFHHEMAQTPYYPTRLFFFCELAAQKGGSTPICRSDWVWQRLERECPAFARDVAEKGLQYSNVMPGEMDMQSGMGRSWQSTLRAPSREAAEERLSGLNYTWEWQADGSLRATTPVLQGVYDLPDGRRTFFNQLIAAFSGWKDARNDPSKAIRLGDGSPLDRKAVESSIKIAEELAFDIPWQTGDVALVDNYVAMHGRRTFEGPRKVLAAMV